MAKKELTPLAKEIYELMVESGKPMIYAEIKAIIPNANPSSLGALKNAGLVETKEVLVEETVVRKVKRNLYTLISE